MKTSGKVYMLIAYTIFDKIPTGLQNSPFPRPELLAGVDDGLPVHVSHYLWDLGSEGGQGVMRVFTDLSRNFAPHQIV